MAGHSTGSEASVGALWEGPLWISCNQARAAYVLSVRAIIEMVQSDPTENCSEVGADALSCQGQSHDETRWRQGHTFTSTLSLSLAEGTPCPPQAVLRLGNNFSPYGNVLSRVLRSCCFFCRYQQGWVQCEQWWGGMKLMLLSHTAWVKQR